MPNRVLTSHIVRLLRRSTNQVQRRQSRPSSNMSQTTLYIRSEAQDPFSSLLTKAKIKLTGSAASKLVSKFHEFLRTTNLSSKATCLERSSSQRQCRRRCWRRSECWMNVVRREEILTLWRSQECRQGLERKGKQGW